MGWSTGSRLADEIWGVCRKYIPGEHRQRIARKLIEIFEGYDADTVRSESKLLLRDAQLEKSNG
jgi:hypothetical protein